MQGKVKTFNEGKGYGFIMSEGFPHDIFCHVSNISLPPGEYLSQGQDVEFTLAHDKQGRTVARNVQLLGHEPVSTDDRSIERRRQYRTTDMTAASVPDSRHRHRRAAEAVFAPVRQMDVSRGD
jgi:cold shock CspA family protein